YEMPKCLEFRRVLFRSLRRRIAARPAWAQVHGRDELKPSREDDPAADPRDRDRSVLQRLAQRLERVPRELGKLVEEEHATVRKRSEEHTSELQSLRHLV